jgi:hypothetical protein
MIKRDVWLKVGRGGLHCGESMYLGPKDFELLADRHQPERIGWSMSYTMQLGSV